MFGFRVGRWALNCGVAAAAAAEAGVSTTAIADSLQVETDVLVVNLAQGNSGVALVRDSGTPANDLDIVELTQQDTDILIYTAPHIKYVTGPAGGLQRYAAHNKFRTATTWENAGAGAGDSNVTISGNDVTFNAASAYTFRASGGTVGAGLVVGRFKLTSDTTVSNVRCRLYGSTDADYLDTTLESLTAGVASVIELSGDGAASSQQCQMVIDQRSGGDDLSGVTITIEEVQVYNGPADSTYLANTGTDRYAIPQTHIASTLTSSTNTFTPALGALAISTVASGTLSDGADIRVSDVANPDTNWLTATVDASGHTGTALAMTVDHLGPSPASASSWHIIEIEEALREPGKTNLVTESGNLASSDWSKSSKAVITSNSTTGVTGETTADTLGDDGSTGTGTVYFNQSLSVSTSTQHVVSALCKEKQLGWVALAVLDFTTPAGIPYAYFNISTGVAGTADAGFDDSGIIDYGNGWYRVWASFTTDAADTTGTLRFYVAEGDGDRVIDYDGTSDIYFDGIQFEEGSVPTSYIHTAGATVARAADDLSKAASELPIGTTEHFLLVSATVNDFSDDPELVSLVEDATNRMSLRVDSSGDPATYALDGGVDQSGDVDAGTVVAGTPFKLAGSFKANDFVASKDGAAISTDTSGTLGITPATLEFGSGGGSNTGIVIVKFVKILPYQPTDAQHLLESA